MVAIFYLIWPSYIRSMLQAVDCSIEVDGKSYLSADARQECDTNYAIIKVLAWAFIVVFGIGPFFSYPVFKKRLDIEAERIDITSVSDRRNFVAFLKTCVRTNLIRDLTNTVGESTEAKRAFLKQLENLKNPDSSKLLSHIVRGAHSDDGGGEKTNTNTFVVKKLIDPSMLHSDWKKNVSSSNSNSNETMPRFQDGFMEGAFLQVQTYLSGRTGNKRNFYVKVHYEEPTPNRIDKLMIKFFSALNSMVVSPLVNVLCCNCVRRKKSRLSEVNFKHSFYFVYGAFRHEMRCWDFVTQARKFVLLAIIAWVPKGLGGQQISFALFALFMFTLAQLYYRPFRNDIEDNLEIFSLAATLATLIAGQFLALSEKQIGSTSAVLAGEDDEQFAASTSTTVGRLYRSIEERDNVVSKNMEQNLQYMIGILNIFVLAVFFFAALNQLGVLNDQMVHNATQLVQHRSWAQQQSHDGTQKSLPRVSSSFWKKLTKNPSTNQLPTTVVPPQVETAKLATSADTSSDGLVGSAGASTATTSVSALHRGSQRSSFASFRARTGTDSEEAIVI